MQPGYTLMLTAALATNENLVTNYGKGSMILKGGYTDENFTAQSGFTRLASLTISDTAVTVDSIAIW